MDELNGVRCDGGGGENELSVRAYCFLSLFSSI